MDENLRNYVSVYSNHNFYIIFGNFQDSEEPETIGSGSSVDYVWDDSTLPHKLVVKIDGNYYSLVVLFCLFMAIYTFTTTNQMADSVGLWFCRYS